MSEIRYYQRLRSADWRKHPSKVAFWLTLWLVGATRVVTEVATSAPGWWPVIHLVGLFCITAIVVEMFAGKVRR